LTWNTTKYWVAVAVVVVADEIELLETVDVVLVLVVFVVVVVGFVAVAVVSVVFEVAFTVVELLVEVLSAEDGVVVSLAEVELLTVRLPDVVRLFATRDEGVATDGAALAAAGEAVISPAEV